MLFRFSGLIVFFVIISFNSANLYSQMPDWTFFRDREGNAYYFDKAFKIIITDESAFDYPPVSEKGIDYYYNAGLEYIKKGEMARGLYFFKSVMALKSGNNRIRKIQIDSAEQVKILTAKNGPRMENYNNESSILVLKEDKSFKIINESLFYSLSFSHRPWIIREGWKYSGKGYGIKFGINSGNSKAGAYDFMGGIETRLLPYSPESVFHAEQIWEREVGPDAFKREIYMESGKSRIYRFVYPGDSPLRGYEGVFCAKGMVHLIRLMYHEKMESAVEEYVKEIIKSFTTVQ